jgi:hypothetical protein
LALIVLPEGTGNARSSFRLLECDSPGGNADKIPAEDSGVSHTLQKEEGREERLTEREREKVPRILSFFTLLCCT